MHSAKHFRGWLVALLVGGSLGLSIPVWSAERYTLVLKDGRRIDIAAFEEADGRLYYYRYDARIGIARDKIAKIITNTPSETGVPLEDEIMGRIAREHRLRFSLGDFLREDYHAAEIAPRLSPEEQKAYVRKLLALKKIEIFEIDDQRQVAEKNGDVVEIALLEKKLIRALDDWAQGQAALVQISRRQRPDRAVDGPQVASVLPVGAVEPPAAGNGDPPPGLARHEPAAVQTGLERLRQRRDTLRLVIYKHYPAVQHKGGFHTLQQANEELRIIELQIRFFDRLSPLPPSAPLPAEDGSAAQASPIE